MTGQIRLGAILWVLSFEFIAAQFVTQGAWPDYSMAQIDLSPLGVTECEEIFGVPGRYSCSPLHAVFNVGAVINGVLVALGTWFSRSLWPDTAIAKAALWVLGLCGGFGMILIGAFPLNVSGELHTAGAMLAMFLPCFAFATLAYFAMRAKPTFAAYSAITAVVSFVALILYALEITFGMGRGAMERVSAWPLTMWYPVTGLLMLTGYLKQNDWRQ